MGAGPWEETENIRESGGVYAGREMFLNSLDQSPSGFVLTLNPELGILSSPCPASLLRRPHPCPKPSPPLDPRIRSLEAQERGHADRPRPPPLGSSHLVPAPTEHVLGAACCLGNYAQAQSEVAGWCQGRGAHHLFCEETNTIGSAKSNSLDENRFSWNPSTTASFSVSDLGPWAEGAPGHQPSPGQVHTSRPPTPMMLSSSSPSLR